MTEFLNTYGFLIVSMLLAALLALSLYLPLMAGQLSLASAGFYAIGGYIAAVLSTKGFTAVGPNYHVGLMLVEMAIAAVVCGALAFLVGIPALRLRGIYLALATIALVEIVRVVSLTLPLLGGAVGIFAIPQPFPTRLDYIWVAGPLLLICIAFFYRLERIRVGRAFAAIREDELAAASTGINPTYYKVLAFVMGGILAGAVGALAAHFLNTWNARQGTFDYSVLILAYVIIGGSRTFAGPIVGGLLLTALPEVLRALSGLGGMPPWVVEFLQEGRLIIYGLLIAFGSLFFPQGLIAPDLFQRRPARANTPPGSAPAASEQPTP